MHFGWIESPPHRDRGRKRRRADGGAVRRAGCWWLSVTCSSCFNFVARRRRIRESTALPILLPLLRQSPAVFQRCLTGSTPSFKTSSSLFPPFYRWCLVNYFDGLIEKCCGPINHLFELKQTLSTETQGKAHSLMIWIWARIYGPTGTSLNGPIPFLV